MSKKITLENVDSSELPEIPVIGEVKQIRFTQDMELVSTLADSDLFMVQVGADLEARPNTITFDLIIKNLSGPIEEGSKKFVTGDEMFKVIGDITLLDTWDNTNIVSSLNATYVNVRRIEEELRREINRSTGKDEQHDEQIANLRQDLTATNEMLNQEINRSVAKDKEHDDLLAGLRDDVDSTSDKLDAEIDRSTAKDAEHDTLLKGLRVDVNANKSAIDSEVARSTARDEAHDTAIAKNASDITTEVNRAKAEEAKIRQEMKTADTNLQNAITAETERATGVEEDLQQQITDLSGSTDDRLEALEALSHEQNTDTGTTSKTFVIDSGNTGAMLKAEGGGLSTRTKGDAGYANFTVQNLVIKGDVTQEGDTFITQAERVEVRDNMILINEGETGAGVTAGFAGIEVDRGTEQNFMFGFNESDGMFKIGKEGNMFDVALRQPVGEMTDGMFASWDAATKTFKTTNVIPYNKSLDFKYGPEIYDVALKMKLGGVGLELSMSDSDDILSLTPGVTSDEVKCSLISTNTNGIIFGDYSGSSNYFILDIEKFSFINTVLDKNVIMGGKNAYFSYYSHRMGSPNTIIASCGVKAPSFYRASDNAEVLYAVDPTTLTDGMFLSWDADNKKVVTTNKLPIGKKLYIAYDHTYITEGGSDGIEFNTRDAWLRVSTGSVESRFVSSANWFLFEGNISTTGKIATTGTNLRLENKSNYLSIGNGASTMDTTLKATTFYRSSDNSEVLYQADLKSVLTGKETNYAPTVKAVSDAIDAVNTGTTESLKNYLPLAGGTMTGSITMPNSVFLKAKNVGGTAYNVISVNANNNVEVGNTSLPLMLVSSSVDIIHYRDGASYKMWDIKNLPDPATKSGNNAFTGKNSFVGGKFFVTGSESEVYVSAVGNLVTRSTYGTKGWVRSLEFSDNNVVVARFGVKATTTDNVPTTDFVGILVGDGTVNNSQYKFRTNKLTVPKSWSMIDGENDAITLTSNSSIFGRISTPLYLRGDNTDLFHTKNSTNYKVWDASNLPTPASTSDIPDVSDMARRSEANTFTANNSFTAGQFSVGRFRVSSSGSFGWGGNVSGGWARECYFYSGSSGDTSPVIAFGGFGDGIDNTVNYAYIRVGNDGYANASYKFWKNKLYVPSSWELVDSGTDTSVILYNNANAQHIGRGIGVTYVRSGNDDLYHTKGSTNYKILDESNYSQYLPTTSKWAYGFVTIEPGKTKVDFNTVLSGSDSPKILFNYNHELGSDTNAPTGMKCGAVLQIDGNYHSSYSNNTLRPQLAFDVNHNVENGTRYMWFRIANNLGYGDSSNWKRVLTSDEYVTMLLVDTNGYPTIKNSNGTEYQWLRTPTSGLLPNKQVSLAGGGNSYIGTSDWYFQRAYIANVYANKFITSGGSSSQFLKGDGSLDSTAYLPLTGGTMSGSIICTANSLMMYTHNDGACNAISVNKTDGSGYLMLGDYSSGMRVFLLTNDSDVVHYISTDKASGTPYRMWDEYNLNKPVRWGGSAAGIHTIYARNLGINGTTWGFLSENNSNSTSIYAPTTAGTSGQILKSSGTGAPVWANVSTILSDYATQSWVTSQGYLTSITKSMVTTALGYTPPTTNTTYSQATSSTLGLVKIGATGLASKNYAVQLNSSGQMYVAVPWTDTNTTYNAATSSTYGLVKIGATGLASKNYAVQLNSSGQMYVNVPWTDTDTNTHYTTRLYAGASGTAANSATTSPYIKVTDDNTYRNQIRLLGRGATSVSSDASGNITITSTNTTYGLATASSNGLMSSSQYTKLSNCIETVSATNMVTSVQVVDTIPATSSQVTGRLYLKFA